MTSVTWLRLGWLGLLAATLTATAQEKNPAITDPAKADADFAVLGDYVGELRDEAGQPQKYGVQVVALGSGKFRAVAWRGGLPGDGWDKSKKIEAPGETKEGGVGFPKLLGSATLKQGVLTVTSGSGAKLGELKRIVRQSSTLGAKPPEGASILFDGSTADKFTGGKMTDDKLLQAGGRSKQMFKDFTLHVEFRCPYQCKLNGNSGVYLQNIYEIQIIDSFGKDQGKGSCGAIYGIRAPDVNVSFPPLSWQTFDVQFQAARFADDGTVQKNPVVTVRHNGVVIHENAELPPKGTDGGKLAAQGGPLYLQYYGGSPVHFRNIWVAEK
ncbi:hypothetical protein AYO44_13220 [Planctomycetaceae bacterium SCGC AG-212-F19]|nr:hypothetical protein AYO44_13220 [Planctomycetaceae bacterium SCGC AG-212-F19]